MTWFLPVGLVLALAVEWKVGGKPTVICHPVPPLPRGTQAKPALQLTRPAGMRREGPRPS